MQTLTNSQPIGQTTIGKTTYLVYRLEVQENSRKAGILHRFGLEGPNGATYFVQDYGPKYRLNSVALGGSKTQTWRPSPRPLRGLERSHLAAFGVEA